MCQKMLRKINFEIVYGGSGCLKKHFREAWMKSVVKRRRWSERSVRERARKEKIAREEERARKLARAREAQEEDEARDKKRKMASCDLIRPSFRKTSHELCLQFEKHVMNYVFDL